MGAKYLCNKFTRFVCTEWIRDKEVRGRMICAPHRRLVGSDLLERRCQAVGIACEKRARSIGEEFPPSRYRHLYELCGNRREDDGNNARDEEERIFIIAVTVSEEAHAEEDVRNNRDESREHDRDGHDENV